MYRDNFKNIARSETPAQVDNQEAKNGQIDFTDS